MPDRQMNYPAEASSFDHWIAEKKDSGVEILLTHEPEWPVAILLQQLDGVVLPKELIDMGLADESTTSQFQSRIFFEPADVVVLSSVPDVTTNLWQRREHGYLFVPPPGWEQKWSSKQRDWFLENFIPLGQTSVEQFRQDFGRLMNVLQQERETQVMVYGCASYDPADNSHNYHSTGETLALRAHRFNHALFLLSQQTGAIVIDVDRLIAEIGGAAHVRQVFQYSPEANETIGRELVRIIEDLGFFDEHPLLKLELPKLDQQFQSGSIVKWHSKEGKWVKAGDDLFDFRVEEIKRMKRINTDSPDQIENVEIKSRNWSWLVRVTAVDNGFFRQRFVSEQEVCTIGDLLAVFSTRENERVKVGDKSISDAPNFRVVVNALESAEADAQENQANGRSPQQNNQ
jgi:hypothetical protein